MGHVNVGYIGGKMAKPRRKRFMMSTNNKHSHSVLLDRTGNGVSSKDVGHRHEVRGNRVLSAGEKTHKHTIIR